jgi:hypothetical protein
MTGWRNIARIALAMTCALPAYAVSSAPALPPAAPASTNATNTALPPPAFSPHAHKLRAVDADNRNILLNRPGMITVVVGTNEDSQDAARDAGKAMYPFQGRPDFQLIVVVDLRGSIANWVPSVVTNRMRSSLDEEAIELKPYFLKNGNKGNPRPVSHVVPDFSGTICPQLGWNDGSDDLRVVIFGVDGRELQRLDKVDDMAVLQEDVRAAIQAQVDNEQARITAANKTPGSKLLQPVYQHPPLVSYTPMAKKS